MERSDIRLALPSKGRLYDDSLEFLARCGLEVYRPNPRQYVATIPSLPGLTVILQRPGDIVTSVRQGSADFGITGLDVLGEKNGAADGPVLTLHDELGIAKCRLMLAVPNEWDSVRSLSDLVRWAATQPEPLRVATKFPYLTGRFLTQNNIPHELITVEGTLEIAPNIGYADLISDLVSSGTTLRDNQLHPLEDSIILDSQGCLIGNQETLQQRPEVLQVSRLLLEYIEAHLRAKRAQLVFANIRGESPEAIVALMRTQPHLGGLQGPTISPVYPPAGPDPNTNWFAINIVTQNEMLTQTIAELRAIGGSGVIVAPVTYIFEEEPVRYKQMLAALNMEAQHA
ncbi:MAG: ATP phosphoribosyltransferase [Anaerolineales bacterium]|nr:ATP phosphoribosyltransferase [Anaerolineales bacterium]MCB8960525.1 ATP phosphoribosyltransferase [Ardenticatenales bacterium]